MMDSVICLWIVIIVNSPSVLTDDGCYVTVNGAYGKWSAWSSCTKTCGGGVQSRSRQCNDPPPDPDGLPCVGLSSDTQGCNVDMCPGRLD